jgi:hypothetical protein
MKKRFLMAAMLAVAATSLVAAPAASAATVIGDQCVANQGAEGLGIFEVSAPGNPLPTAAPSNGVITKWSVNLVPAPVVVPTQLKVVRPVGPNQLLIVGESALANVGPGANSFPTRVPIQAGDRIGLYGPSEIGTLYCQTETEKGAFGIFLNAAAGATTLFEQNESNARVPVTATIEPDADNDGYGDETQDACPQSAATQAACPMVTLNISATAQKKLVTLLITGPIAANVTVNGVVSLGKGKKAKLKGGTKAVAPGAFTKFKLKFTSALIKRLEELPPSKKLTLKVTSSAPNTVGAPTKKVIKVKLKGQG